MDSSRSITSLVARVILGIIFIMHGWQKLHTNGIGATEKGFRAMDVPFPEFSAHYATGSSSSAASCSSWGCWCPWCPCC